MQPLPPTGSSTLLKTQISDTTVNTTNTTQNPPALIKGVQLIKPPVQKSAEQSSGNTANNTALVGSEEIGLILLLLINQFIEQMQTDGISDKPISAETPAIQPQTDEINDRQVPAKNRVIEAEVISDPENGKIPPAVNEEISARQNGGKPDSHGLRSLAKFNISLLGFSHQIQGNEFQDIFKNTRPMAGKFETTFEAVDD